MPHTQHKESGLLWNAGSFKDPAGRVFERDGRIFRTMTAATAGTIDRFEASGLYQRLSDAQKLVRHEHLPINDDICKSVDTVWHAVLEHERLPYLSYAFEWPFSLLQRAAVFHLDVLLESLQSDFTLSDASCYNIQFINTKPIFIDTLSFIDYVDNAPWLAHKQFCENFLNPLILSAYTGVPYHPWLQSRLNGLPSTEVASLLPFKARLSVNALVHVFALAKIEGALRKAGPTDGTQRKNTLSKHALVLMLTSLRDYCANLRNPFTDRSIWSGYESENSYDDASQSQKAEIISGFCARYKPELLLDIGCNTGRYSEIALAHGATRAIGVDGDLNALEVAVARADKKNLNLLPLYMDCTNPSPALGWNNLERPGFKSRIKPDAILALALIHHLVIGANISMAMAVSWLVSLAPRGVIEFIPKSDIMIRNMLSTRIDIFQDYHIDCFLAELRQHASIESTITLDSERVLVTYSRPT